MSRYCIKVLQISLITWLWCHCEFFIIVLFRVKSRLVYQITKIEVATIADGWFPTGALTVSSTIIVAVKPKINCKSNVWLYIDYISNIRRSNWSRWMKIRWEIASSDRTFHISCKWGQFFLWADKPISCVNERELIRNAVSLIFKRKHYLFI